MTTLLCHLWPGYITWPEKGMPGSLTLYHYPPAFSELSQQKPTTHRSTQQLMFRFTLLLVVTVLLSSLFPVLGLGDGWKDEHLWEGTSTRVQAFL